MKTIINGKMPILVNNPSKKVSINPVVFGSGFTSTWRVKKTAIAAKNKITSIKNAAFIPKYSTAIPLSATPIVKQADQTIEWISFADLSFAVLRSLGSSDISEVK